MKKPPKQFKGTQKPAARSIPSKPPRMPAGPLVVPKGRPTPSIPPLLRPGG